MKYFERLLLGIVSTVLFAGWIKPASAEISCNIDFAYGLAVNDTQLRVMEKSRTRVQINDQTQLFIDGRWQTLTAEQSEWLGE